MSDTELEEDALKHYQDPKKGYWGKTKMMAKYRKILKNMYALQRHREIKAKMIRKNMRPIKAPAPFYSVQCDLAFWDKQARQNDGVIGLLVVIDVFSRYLWVKKIYNKGALHIGLKSVIDRMKSEFDQIPLHMTADNEFDTKELKKLAGKYDFRWYFSDPGEKYRTGVVERVIRTLRNLIKRYETTNNTLRYVDVLPSLVDNYNNTDHRTINKTPTDAIKTGKINDKRERQCIPEIKKNEKVRIQEIRRKTFDKGDVPYYSKDVFRVVGRDMNRYILKDEDGNELPKRYGRSQLYHIDKVIGQNNKDKRVGYDEQKKRNKRRKKNKSGLKRIGLDLKNIIKEDDRREAEIGLGFVSPPSTPSPPPEIQRMDKIDDAIAKSKNIKKKKQLQNKKNKQFQSKPLPQPSIPSIPPLPSDPNSERMRHLQNRLNMYRRSSRPNAIKMARDVQRQIRELRRNSQKHPPKLANNAKKRQLAKNVQIHPPKLPNNAKKRQLAKKSQIHPPKLAKKRQLPPLPHLPPKRQLPPLPPLRRSSRIRKKPDRYQPIDFRKPKPKRKRKRKDKPKQIALKDIDKHIKANIPKFNIGKINNIKRMRKKHKEKK